MTKEDFNDGFTYLILEAVCPLFIYLQLVIQKIATSIQRLLQFLLLCFSAIIVNAVVTPWFLIAAVPICIVYFVTQRFYRCSARLVTLCRNWTFQDVIMHVAQFQVSCMRHYYSDWRFYGLPSYCYTHSYPTLFYFKDKSRLMSHLAIFISVSATFKILKILVDFHSILYEHYATGGHPITYF